MEDDVFVEFLKKWHAFADQDGQDRITNLVGQTVCHSFDVTVFGRIVVFGHASRIKPKA